MFDTEVYSNFQAFKILMCLKGILSGFLIQWFCFFVLTLNLACFFLSKCCISKFKRCFLMNLILFFFSILSGLEERNCTGVFFPR